MQFASPQPIFGHPVTRPVMSRYRFGLGPHPSLWLWHPFFFSLHSPQRRFVLTILSVIGLLFLSPSTNSRGLPPYVIHTSFAYLYRLVSLQPRLIQFPIHIWSGVRLIVLIINTFSPVTGGFVRARVQFQFRSITPSTFLRTHDWPPIEPLRVLARPLALEHLQRESGRCKKGTSDMNGSGYRTGDTA